MTRVRGIDPCTPTAGASPVLSSGVYKIRIQYEEGFGANTIQLLSDTAPIIWTAYLVPSNRTPQPNAADNLRETVGFFRDWFADQINFNNHLFTIRSDRLQAAAPLDPDPGTVYEIRVRSTDQGGLWTERPLAIDPGLPLPTFLAATPDPVTRPHNLTLSVLPLEAQDPGLVQVHFYREETLLGADQDGAVGWSWTGSTEGWPVGQFRFYARGQDSTGAWSELASVNGIVTSWQNPDNPFDVDGNGHVAPLDVLTIIKHRSRNNCPMSPRPSWERAG